MIQTGENPNVNKYHNNPIVFNSNNDAWNIVQGKKKFFYHHYIHQFKDY